MKTYRDVTITGSRDNLTALRAKLRAEFTRGPWRCRTDLPSRFGDENTVPLQYDGPRAPAALVWLVFENEQATVTNIVPKEPSSLTYDQYNLIAEAFVREVVDPLASQLGLTVELGDESYDIQELAGPEVIRALRAFSSGANKSTGSAHPQDAARWDAFVVAAHRARSQLDEETLMQWLIQEEEWDEDMAIKLVIQYEQGRRLLTYYDETLSR